MPAMQFGLSSYDRARGGLPELPVFNMFLEEAPTEERGIMLQSRPGLTDRAADMGVGPIRQLFKRDLVLDSKLYGVSGNGLYEETSKIGAILGTGFVSMAGNEIGLMTTAGRSLYFYNGTLLSQVVFPDNADVAHVSVGGSRYWMVRKDTGKLYWTDALESDVDALDFLTAESLPDRLLQTLWIDGGLIGFGAESVEFFQQAGSADLPLVPLTNMVFEKGLKATGCASPIGTSFAFVTNGNQVCYQRDDNVISNAGLEERIAASSECRLFNFFIGGNEFLGLRLDNEFQAWSLKTGSWSEFTSYGQANWIPQCHADGVFGSSIDGRTLAWGDGHVDLESSLERKWRAGFPINGGGLNISNVRARVNVGQTPYLTGDYTEPEIELWVSDDAGQTFSYVDAVSLGAQGNYREMPEWRALGQASWPGFVCEFRVTDPVDVRVSDCLVNEQYGGR